MTQASSLRKRGYDAVIFCPSQQCEFFVLDEVPVYTFSFRRRKNSVLNFLSMMKNCWSGWRAHFGGNEPAVLHGHDYMTFFLLSWYLSDNVVKVFTVHDPMVYHHRMLGTLPATPGIKEKVMAYIEKSVYARSGRIHVISEYTRVRIENYKLLEPKIRLVPDWVDMDRFVLPQDKQNVRQRLSIAPDVFVVYTLRALQERMGLANLISGFQLVKQKIPSAILIIGGKGPLRGELEKLAQELGIAEAVTFLGYVPDEEVVPRYQAADVFLMPSLDGEGFGLPVLEAMACGTPVLASPACALPEVLKGKPARILSGTEPADIAAGILSFYSGWLAGDIHPSDEQKYVMENFSESDILKLILTDYKI
jgi:glycosyltransferase involved in cell wall biosynthesis